MKVNKSVYVLMAVDAHASIPPLTVQVSEWGPLQTLCSCLHVQCAT